MLLFALFLSAAAVTPPVSERAGNIYCGATQITNLGTDGQPELSPDGHTIAFVRFPSTADRIAGLSDQSELWVGDCNSTRITRMLTPRSNDQPKRNLTMLSWPTFSLEGGYIYVMSYAWVTSGAIHQIRVSDGGDKFVTDGNSLSVIRNGPYRGYLLIEQHRYHDGGGSYDATYVVRPDGHVEMMVPESDTDSDSAVSEWLKSRGWTAW